MHEVLQEVQGGYEDVASQLPFQLLALHFNPHQTKPTIHPLLPGANPPLLNKEHLE